MDEKQIAKLRNQALFEQLMRGIGDRMEDLLDLVSDELVDLEQHRQLIKGLAAGMIGIYYDHLADVEEGLDNV
jgi:hypothetical protein